jgi:hypothetical protein
VRTSALPTFLALLSLLASFLIPPQAAASPYVVSGSKAYLLDDSDLRVITTQGSRRLPLFGFPVTILSGTRPYVLTSQALFSIDPVKEEVTSVSRLDRSYSAAGISRDDRIYLVGGNTLTVFQGGALKFTLLYSYELPATPDDMFFLPSGDLLFTGSRTFTYNPGAKSTSDVPFACKPAHSFLAANTVVLSEGVRLFLFNLSLKKSDTISFTSEIKQIKIWRDKVLAATSSEIMVVDPASSSVIARSPLLGVVKLSVVDSDTLAVALLKDAIVTLSLPGLANLDSYNASCDDDAAAYPFFHQPLFVCKDKLALPGGAGQSKTYLVQSVKPQEGPFFALQVGAFSNLASVGTLMERLANQGLPYYTLQDGNLTKFRVGYFHTREEAEHVRSFLGDIDSWIVTEKTQQSLVHSIHDLNHDVRPDGIVSKGDSVLVLTLRDQTWIEVLKASKLPEPATEVYLQGNKAYARLQQSGLRELVLPDTSK